MSVAESFGLVVLVICVVASIIAFVTPYWLESDDIITGRHHMGLLAKCKENSCKWMFEDDMLHQKYAPDWFKATQGLMTVGLVVGLLALLVATLALCCSCKNCNPNHAVAVLLVVGFLCIGVAVVVFAIKASDERNAKLKWDFDTLVRFSWSFWVAIAAAGLSLVTAVIYSCMNRKYA
ncbi:hypothetical protein ACJMK2_004589 [Sinanodonta woodiana]|uniref:Uncharacterized protein n=1 Tax=Sinanodonta woodiana TaxID=1069815 RepID=A0ABD3Y1M6_SINWO